MLSPKRVLDLTVIQTSNREAVLSYTEVGDGEGGVAKQDLRFMDSPIQWGEAQRNSTEILPLAESAIGKRRQVIVLLDALGPLGPEGAQVDFQTISFRGNLRTGAVPFPDPPATFPDPGEDGSRFGNIATLTIEHFEELPKEPDPADDPASNVALVRKERVVLQRVTPWLPLFGEKYGVAFLKYLGDVDVPE